jgi:hypothetical protein
MIAWLNANAAAVSALASIGSAVAAIVLMITTIVYAIYTWQLAVENRLLRKAGTDPQVVGYAAINPRVFGAVDFVIRNIGRGAARNVSYRIVAGGDDLRAKNVRVLPAGVKFAFLPQDEQLAETMGMGWNLLADPPLALFEIEICYEDMAGNPYAERFKIDVGQFNGLGRLGSPPEEEIVESLKKIARVMEQWSHQRLQVETMSVTERREHDEQVRRMMEERRSNRDDLANDRGTES